MLKKITRLILFFPLSLAAFFLTIGLRILQLCTCFLRIFYRRLKKAKKKLLKFFSSTKIRQNNEGEQSIYAPLHIGRQKVLDKILTGEFTPSETKRDVVIDMSIVTHNSHKHLKSLFESIKKQAYPIALINLIFVDSCSTDNITVDELYFLKQKNESLFHSITILPLKKNIGFGRSHNHAFQFRKGKFFLVTNPDLVFEENAIDNIVRFALADDLSKVASWEFRQKPYEHPKYYDPITLKTFWSSGACLLINPQAFSQAGGYDKHIFMYGEDVELSYRFIDTGWDVKYCPFAVVWHYTYQGVEKFKAIQFTRSLCANGLLKLRYGNNKEILASIFQLPYLFFREAIKLRSSSTRRCFLIFFSYFIYLRSAPIFLYQRKRSARAFPFCGFDYLIARHGAFYHHYPQASDSKQPLVSIIMRTHGNQILWLRESIASVLRQTYENIELIIVEDGGSCTKSFIEEVNAKRPKIKIKYFSLPKQGRSVTGNVGLSEATGDFMMFLDSDDYLYADHVEILVQELQANTSVDIVYSLAWEVATQPGNEEKKDSCPQEFSYTLHSLYLKNFSLDALQQNNLLPIQSAMFKRSVYEKNGGFDTQIEYLEDWNLWLRYAHNCQFKQVFKLTSCYRVPYDQDVFNARTAVLKEARNLAFKSYQDFVLDKNITTT